MRDRDGPSAFYLGTLLGLTNFWLRLGFPVGGFIHGQLAPTSVSKAGWTRGMSFVDMINNHKNIVIVPHPIVPKAVMTAMLESCALRVPPEDLVLSEDYPLPVHNKLLDEIVAQFPAPASAATEDMAKIKIYVRSYQLTEALAKCIISTFHSVPIISHIDYVPEAISNKFYGYRVTFYCHRITDTEQ